MNQVGYIAPEFEKKEFHCPNCNVYANQYWYSPSYISYSSASYVPIENHQHAHCAHCKKVSVWINNNLVYPPKITAPLAHKDMPEPVMEYYNEAREISAASPRAAAALLRIAAKKLCEALGEDEANLNHAIGNLSKIGLPENVIKSLDTVRIVGNEGGAHEGQIDLSGEDNKDIVDRLFWLINFIVEKTITEPKEIENAFNSLPENKRTAVEERDKIK